MTQNQKILGRPSVGLLRRALVSDRERLLFTTPTSFGELEGVLWMRGAAIGNVYYRTARYSCLLRECDDSVSCLGIVD